MATRRAEKKEQTRQRISDVATGLFLAHGFDAVTLNDVAKSAGVARMTVFNYFPRKEDLMLDRLDDLKMTLLREAIRGRRPGQPTDDALRALVDDLRAQRHPFVRVDSGTVDWWRFVMASPALIARLREHYDEAAAGLALDIGGCAPDDRARLAAGMIVLAVRTAREESVRAFDRGANEDEVTTAFFRAVEHGLDAVGHLLGSR